VSRRPAVTLRPRNAGWPTAAADVRRRGDDREQTAVLLCPYIQSRRADPAIKRRSEPLETEQMTTIHSPDRGESGRVGLIPTPTPEPDGHRSRATGHQKPSICGQIVVITTTNAPEWTRTITGKSPHKALNLARLPIPPRAQRGPSIAPARPSGGCRKAGVLYPSPGGATVRTPVRSRPTVHPRGSQQTWI
jgi:hypothetical protein